MATDNVAYLQMVSNANIWVGDPQPYYSPVPNPYYGWPPTFGDSKTCPAVPFVSAIPSAMPPEPRLWRCDYCRTPNMTKECFCTQCGAPRLELF